jgi:response regulator RpfG family c-di-GMP phosphodiesterase
MHMQASPETGARGLAAALRTEPDPLTVADGLFTAAFAGAGGRGLALVLLDPVHRRFELTRGLGLSEGDAAAVRAAIDEGVVDWVVEAGQGRFLPSLGDAGDWLCLPLVTAGQAVGALLATGVRSADKVAADVLERLAVGCDLLAPAFAAAAAADRAATLRAQVHAVAEAARALGSAADLTDNLRRIAQLAFRAAACEGAALYLPGPGGTVLERRGAEGPLPFPATCPRGAGVAGWVAEHRIPIAISRYAADTRIAQREVDPPGLHTVIAAPAGLSEHLPGVLLLANSVDRPEFTDRDLAVLMALADEAAVALERARLYEDLRHSYLATMYALANAVEARDPYTRGHSERVTRMALMAAELHGWAEAQCREVEMGGILHDIGKIGVPDAILRKPSELSEAEFAVIKTHPEVGERMLRGILHLEPAIPYILCHQERYNGMGYPAGLAGESIPMQGRLLAVADAIDAYTSNRPYRQGAPLAGAIDILRQESGRQFDPGMVDAYLALFESGRLGAYLETAPGRRMDRDALGGLPPTAN